MGEVPKGELQQPRIELVYVEAEHPVEYTVSILRVLARKDEGEPFTQEERFAVRNALRLLGREW